MISIPLRPDRPSSSDSIEERKKDGWEGREILDSEGLKDALVTLQQCFVVSDATRPYCPKAPHCLDVPLQLIGIEPGSKSEGEICYPADDQIGFHDLDDFNENTEYIEQARWCLRSDLWREPFAAEEVSEGHLQVLGRDPNEPVLLRGATVAALIGVNVALDQLQELHHLVLLREAQGAVPKYGLPRVGHGAELALPKDEGGVDALKLDVVAGSRAQQQIHHGVGTVEDPRSREVSEEAFRWFRKVARSLDIGVEAEASEIDSFVGRGVFGGGGWMRDRGGVVG
ncbi:hypothetical protein MUK42_03994 [Musa troglodytarum]|uniref:Uncharacterized protein n=1 Tax=Musa troglodytarum TaxID=320322 RepID=A0A9E7G4A0_9LILI|nr:hypothetical protein MUK42_03994 [Musa troglodytarum]